ncbi:hypothetical protein CHS0354_025470 [Potamilus streckersoni]|uniref:Rho-GAP domain-containing protein n=1 Tax=Potamilus streckersoni TaxID=2493646 RepID=A0AAE0RRT6_9BIVA|nr:hypothetical protein CHS0354_025470 [Potamilus streckersoni]
MSFENSDQEKSYTAEDGKKKDASKKKDKKDKKEKGYIMFDEEDSGEELVLTDELKSPSKMKKAKAFRFAKKDIFQKTKEKEKDEKKDKDSKKEEKEKKKEEKEGKKHKSKDKKKPKHGLDDSASSLTTEVTYDKPIFGVPLSVAVERNRSHDGIELPAIFRECIDYIEEHGLLCEGIYRISGVKSKVQHLKECYNRGEPVYLEEHEPNIVASLLKLFLRDLPEPVLTNALMPKFEEASTIKSEKKRVESFHKLINELPVCNRLLLSWMIVHMTHVIEKQRENKMTLQNVSIVLSPTMQISHRVLNVLFSYTKQLFRDRVIKKYVPPLKPATSKWSLELPDNTTALEEELAKQESLLNQLHQELNAGTEDPNKAEQLWEVQRVVTQLKRKIKLGKKKSETAEQKKKNTEEFSKKNVVFEDEELCLELREVPKEPEVAEQSNKKVTKETDHKATSAEGRMTLKDLAKQSGSIGDLAKQSGSIGDLARQSGSIGDLAKQSGSSGNIAKQGGSTGDVAKHSGSAGDVREKRKSKELEQDISRQSGSDQQDSVEITVKENVTERVREHEEDQAKTEQVPESGVELTPQTVVPKAIVQEEIASSTQETDVKVKMFNAVASDEPHVTQQVKVKTTTEEVRVDSEEKPKLPALETMKDSADDVGRSNEDINQQYNSDDEFENSLEEILEREGVAMETEMEVNDQEIPVTVFETDDQEDVGKARDEASDEGLDFPTPTPPDIEEFRMFAEQPVMDEEYQSLLEEEYALKLEEEELVQLESELRQKIETEKSEIERLHQEIAELQYLRQDSDLEDMSSSSESSYESDEEEDLQEILDQLLHENEELERKNAELGQKVHEERMICLGVKVQIRLLQQKQLGDSLGSDAFLEKDSLIEL